LSTATRRIALSAPWPNPARGVVALARGEDELCLAYGRLRLLDIRAGEGIEQVRGALPGIASDDHLHVAFSFRGCCRLG